MSWNPASRAKEGAESRWSSEDARVPLFLQIAAGVFIGNLAAALVVWRVAVWQAERAVQDAAAALQAANAAAAAEVRRSREAAQQLELTRRFQAADAIKAEEQAKRRAADEAARREAAWEKFYRKPTRCDEARGGSWTVDCANEFIRTKKRFAELYEAGKL